MAGGRPTALTHEVKRAILASLRAGNYISTACQAAGVAESTFYKWAKEAEEGKNKAICEFIESCKQAISKAEEDGIVTVKTAGAKDWKAIAWWLARRHSKRWGNNSESGDKSPRTTAPQPEE
jgi:hypothetical protein